MSLASFAFSKLVFWLALLSLSCRAVDESKFRTCEQGSFCRRYRKYIQKVDTASTFHFEGSLFAHELDSTTLTNKGHVVTAKINHVHDSSVKPLLLDLRFFRDDVNNNCGIVRAFITEEDPLHPRFRLTEGDVIRHERELKPDKVSMVAGQVGTTELTSVMADGSVDDCQVTLRHRPFELEVSYKRVVIQRMNSKHFLNFERYRVQHAPARHSDALVDATDVDGRDLWQESFGGHTDSKPRGPAAVGVDVFFEDAVEVYGLAEHAAGLGLAENRFDEPYRFFNLDVFEYALNKPMALYGAVPLVTALHKSANPTVSGFFFSNPSEGFVKVESSKKKKGASGIDSWWLFESGVLDVFFFMGPTPENVLEQYHTVTGFPRMPPLATLGKHQSRWNYVDVEDAVGVNRKFDQHDIPYDVLWLDIEHTDGKKYFTWHPSHFANPGTLLDALEASKRHLVTIVDPHIKKCAGYDVYNKIKNHDYFTKTKDGGLYDGWCWPGTSSYPDFCNPAVRGLWATFFKMDYYPHNRVDLWTWNDMNEPSVFNGPEVTMPRDNLHKCSSNSYGVEHRDVHNVYGFYHHMATVEGHLLRAPNVRPFVLTRSFFAGSHRLGAIWTGDNMAKWEHLAISVPMLVSLCMCGTSFVGADVPGFFYDAEPELFKRWHQLGIWYPFYRGHAHLETKRREPWMLGEEITQNVREQVTARYQMLPTWYTLFAKWALQGKPILRPVWYSDWLDDKARAHQNDHFLVGENILVRAITHAGQSNLNVYLPKGRWFDFWDPKASQLDGGREHTVAVSASHVPAYVRDGRILAKKMRRRRSTGAMAADPYTLVVYGGRAKGDLYVDDGQSHDFKKGAFIYDEMGFDGKVLESKPGQALHVVGAAQGLPAVPKRYLRVERVTFVGLEQEVRAARLVQTGMAAVEDLLVTSEGTTKDNKYVVTIKKPMCLLGSSWKLELSF